MVLFKREFHSSVMLSNHSNAIFEMLGRDKQINVIHIASLVKITQGGLSNWSSTFSVLRSKTICSQPELLVREIPCLEMFMAGS